MKHINLKVASLVLMLFSSNLLADECDSVNLAIEEKRYKNALEYVQPLLLQKEVCATHYKGLMLLRGYGLKMDKPAGIALIKKAANKAYEPAIEFLDHYY